jgi:hypothetical protein
MLEREVSNICMSTAASAQQHLHMRTVFGETYRRLHQSATGTCCSTTAVLRGMYWCGTNSLTHQKART